MLPTTSATPPTSVLTVGRPHIIASMIVYGMPSEMLDSATTWPSAYACRLQVTGPDRSTAARRPSRSISARQLAAYSRPVSGTGPASRSRASGSASRTVRIARISVCRSLSGSIRPTQVIVGTVGSVASGG